MVCFELVPDLRQQAANALNFRFKLVSAYPGRENLGCFSSRAGQVERPNFYQIRRAHSRHKCSKCGRHDIRSDIRFRSLPESHTEDLESRYE